MFLRSTLSLFWETISSKAATQSIWTIPQAKLNEKFPSKVISGKEWWRNVSPSEGLDRRLMKPLRGRNIGSPGHFRGVWANPTLRREAPRGRMSPRLPINDWGNVLLTCTCVMSRATSKKKKKRAGIRCLPRPVSLIFVNIKETEPRGMDSYPALLESRGLPGSVWAARGLISQSAFVFP